MYYLSSSHLWPRQPLALWGENTHPPFPVRELETGWEDPSERERERERGRINPKHTSAVRSWPQVPCIPSGITSSINSFISRVRSEEKWALRGFKHGSQSLEQGSNTLWPMNFQDFSIHCLVIHSYWISLLKMYRDTTNIQKKAKYI